MIQFTTPLTLKKSYSPFLYISTWFVNKILPNSYPYFFIFFSKRLVKKTLGKTSRSDLGLFLEKNIDLLYANMDLTHLKTRLISTATVINDGWFPKFFKNKRKLNFPLIKTLGKKMPHLDRIKAKELPQWTSTTITLNKFSEQLKYAYYNFNFTVTWTKELPNIRITNRFINTAATWSKLHSQNQKQSVPSLRSQIYSNNLDIFKSKSPFTLYTNVRTPLYTKYSVLPLHNSYKIKSTLRKYIRNFRLSLSEIISLTPIRKQILEYNLTRIFRPLQRRYIKNFFGFHNSILHLSHRLNSYFINKSITRRFRRRVTNLWLSHYTRRIITPQRHEFMILYRKRFQYQRKITTYILRFYRFKVLEAVHLYEFNLCLFLTRCWFAINVHAAQTLVKQRYVFINGVCVKFLRTSVYGGDLIQLIVNSKFFVLHKWNLIFNRFRLGRFRHFTNYWHLRSLRPYPKNVSHRIPHWVIYNKIIIEEVPLYVELDFTTLSVLLLKHYVHNFTLYHYFSFHETPFASVRAFNWKSYT